MEGEADILDTYHQHYSDTAMLFAQVKIQSGTVAYLFTDGIIYVVRKKKKKKTLTGCSYLYQQVWNLLS